MHDVARKKRRGRRGRRLPCINGVVSGTLKVKRRSGGELRARTKHSRSRYVKRLRLSRPAEMESGWRGMCNRRLRTLKNHLRSLNSLPLFLPLPLCPATDTSLVKVEREREGNAFFLSSDIYSRIRLNRLNLCCLSDYLHDDHTI